MESKYLLELTGDTAVYHGSNAADKAVARLQERVRSGVTLVAVFVKNPRYAGE